VSREGGGRPGKLAGRVAVVTGGGSGLGRAGVLRFAAESAKAATGALQPGRGAEPAAHVRANG